MKRGWKTGEGKSIVRERWKHCGVTVSASQACRKDLTDQHGRLANRLNDSSELTDVSKVAWTVERGESACRTAVASDGVGESANISMLACSIT